LSIEQFVTPFVGLSMHRAAANAATGQPVGEHIRVMVPTDAASSTGHASELGRPQHDRVIEPFRLFEFLQ